MQNNDICARMYDVVMAICGNSSDSEFLKSMIAEMNRLLPIFSKEVSSNPVLDAMEEEYLRKIDESISNFNLVYLPQMENNANLTGSKAYKDFLSLLKMIKTTVGTYFAPPTFEPQQIEPTYKLLMENKNVIADVMGVSPESVANKLAEWLQGGGAHTGSYSDGLLKLFHNNKYLIEQLKGLSDDGIAIQIRKWKNENDKFGKPLIENPNNRLKSEYARELKANGLIKCSVKNFRNKL